MYCQKLDGKLLDGQELGYNGKMGELKDWLIEELKRRGWSQKELTQRSGISQPLISQVLSGERNPSADFCVKIAQAMGEAPETVLRIAEILPPVPSPDDPTIDEITTLIKTLSPDRRAQALEFIRFLAEQQTKRSSD